LRWLLALLQEQTGELKRVFHLDTYFGRGKQVELCLDASPWGLGGFLIEDGCITSWFACSLSAAELELLQIREAESAAQQVVEALAALVALRLWKDRWVHTRVSLKVKSDSISALVLCLDLKTRGKGTGIIAREIALDVAQSEYLPRVVEHIPGVDNIIADALSRRHMPHGAFTLPECLRNVQEAAVAPRDISYYKTTLQPAAAKQQNGTQRPAAGK
jgi:hypothetical protein